MRILTIVSALFLLVGCNFSEPAQQTVTISGKTMGTTYNVKYLADPEKVDAEKLKGKIEETLSAVNKALSNWDKTSEISNFNNEQSTDWYAVSPGFVEVMEEADRISRLSGGRFDVTLAPLINIWGFGPKNEKPDPTETEIRNALQNVGMELVEVRQSPPALKKVKPAVTINLSAIAKGYGVDKVAETLSDAGLTDYLVEIGGDLLTKGKNAEGKLWQIGIEKPDTANRSVHTVVPVEDAGMATSGDYRNYVEKDGVRLSHIIDPVTGRPITHNLASVTVIAENAMIADGMATALFVMGAEDGLKMADKEGIAAFFIVRDGEGFSELESDTYKNLGQK